MLLYIDPTSLMLVIAVFTVISIPIYLLPTFIACGRKHHEKTTIILVNILLGWSLVGWVVSLVLACTDSRPRVVYQPINTFTSQANGVYPQQNYGGSQMPDYHQQSFGGVGQANYPPHPHVN